MLISKIKTELVRKVEIGSMSIQSSYGNQGYSEALLTFGSPLSDPGATIQQQITGQIDKIIKKNSSK